jgi:hypothetical protein
LTFCKAVRIIYNKIDIECSIDKAQIRELASQVADYHNIRRPELKMVVFIGVNSFFITTSRFEKTNPICERSLKKQSQFVSALAANEKCR